MSRSDAGRPVKFFFLDAAAIAPIALFCLYAKAWTFTLLVITLLVLTYLSRKGMRLPSLLRKIRTLLIGKSRLIRPPGRSNL